MARVYLGLGSNLGDRRDNLSQAYDRLHALPGCRILQVSSLFETLPVGGPDGQPPFLNAAVALQTDRDRDPRGLLDRLHAIETAMGRTRVVRWDRRTLDIDLLLFEDRIVDRAELTVPHPRLVSRRFVLEPLAEIAGDQRDPRSGWTIQALRDRLPPSSPPSIRLVAPRDWPTDILDRWKLEADAESERSNPIIEGWEIRVVPSPSIGLDDPMVPTFSAVHPTFRSGQGGGRDGRLKFDELEGSPVLLIDGAEPSAVLDELRAACRAASDPLTRIAGAG